MGKKTEHNYPAILLDSDIIIHFEKAGQIFLIQKIFPKNEKLILDKVLKELEVLPGTRPFAANIVNYRIARPIEFESDSRVKLEYAKLVRKFGKGESACMAYCKFHNEILASSNINDVKQYCLDNNINLLTTMDFLVEALQAGILMEADCDLFIYNVKSKGSRLPCDTMAEFKSMLGI